MHRLRVLSRSDVERLLDMRTCVDAVEDAFRRRGAGDEVISGVLALHSGTGAFHLKAAIMTTTRSYFAAKTNANHALESGAMARSDVRAELSDVIVNPSRGQARARRMGSFFALGE